MMRPHPPDQLKRTEACALTSYAVGLLSAVANEQRSDARTGRNGSLATAQERGHTLGRQRHSSAGATQ